MNANSPSTFRREGIDGLSTEVYHCAYFGFAFSRRQGGKEDILVGPDMESAYERASALYGVSLDKALGNELVMLSPATFRHLLAKAGLSTSAWKDIPDRIERPTKAPAPVSRRRQEIFEKSGGCCHYCGCVLELQGKWHVEHKMPRALGGDNDPINLVAACAPCNYSKGDKTDLEFKAKRETELANALASMKEKA